jgi:tRNA A-37 threonylcarbamoyl transferase component Bud32
MPVSLFPISAKRSAAETLRVAASPGILDLAGEIVSGHPDRHVMRIKLPDGQIGYLKKEHRIRWKDRFENWRAGYGWCSKSEREGRTLQRIEVQMIAPRCLDFCEVDGRAFLLLDAVPNAVDLRRMLHEREFGEELPIALGRFCAELHVAKIDHPDLYAKHFLIDPDTFAITLLDWQRAIIGREVSWRRRIGGLAALAATLPGELLTHLLWGYLREIDNRSQSPPTYKDLKQAIHLRVRQLERRRGVREQRQPPLDANAQRLVWLDGEAVCTLPEVANDLQPHAALYDLARNQSPWPLSNNREGQLRVGIYRRWLHTPSWRPPEVRLARLLFHLERFHIHAPKLLAYGHRRYGGRIEAFVLHEEPRGIVQPFVRALLESNPFRSDFLLQRLVEQLRKLHDAGCAVRSVDAFSVIGEDLTIDPHRLDFRRNLSPRRKRADCRRVIRSIQSSCGNEAAERFEQYWN